ncbi:MAG: multidrug efflux SMR transporter [Phycisphaerales bacterium]|nr:multidrug efflux SMR transporter [Phycisphaerales bacterium]
MSDHHAEPRRAWAPGPSLAWCFLLLAAVCEIGWAVTLPFTEGFTRPGPSMLAVVLTIAAFLPLMVAIRTLAIGTAYAVWTGLGAVGVTTVGMIWLQEPASVPRLLSILAIIVGVVGLKIMQGRTVSK